MHMGIYTPGLVNVLVNGSLRLAIRIVLSRTITYAPCASITRVALTVTSDLAGASRAIFPSLIAISYRPTSAAVTTMPSRTTQSNAEWNIMATMLAYGGE